MIMNTLSKVGVPLFGNAKTAVSYISQKAKSVPRYKNWAVPGVIGGGWFIWPAITDDFKVQIGLLPDPDAEAS